ncbi:MAG: hypothetical protein C4293_15860 [Nitrospiraceae bacterium]
MPTTTQLVISEQSKPGVLARVSSVLAAAGVNIKAFMASEVPGTSKPKKGTMRFVVADLDRARMALKAEKIRFREETALVLGLENKPGALSEVAKHLKEARINITCGYYTPSREGGKAIVILTVSNPKKATEILREESLDAF